MMAILTFLVNSSLFPLIPQSDGPIDSEDSGRGGDIWNKCERDTEHQSLICGALFSVLERKLNEAETEKFNIKQMKDLFEQKAAQLATEIVG